MSRATLTGASVLMLASERGVVSRCNPQADVLSVKLRTAHVTIPFGEPEPSDALLSQSVSSTRLRAWLTTRLRLLAVEQRIQDARALRSEFALE